MIKTLQDKQGRHFKSLRLSVVPHCNFSCTYCTESDISEPTSEPFSPQEFIHFISKINPFLDLYSVRITGGEPTLYPHLPELIYELKKMGIPKVHLTSNGVRLPHLISDLKSAGLDSINISLDALDPHIFQKISRRKGLDKTLAGIDATLNTDIFLKLNCTVMKGINDSEILPLLLFSQQKNIIIRYLELMEMGPLYGNKHKDYFLSTQDILRNIETLYMVTPEPRKRAATAQYWKTNNGHRFGIIANYSMPFCLDCNRLRLDHTGKIYGCLSNSFGTDLKSCDTDASISEALQTELNKKQPVKFQGSPLSMKAIGG